MVVVVVVCVPGLSWGRRGCREYRPRAGLRTKIGGRVPSFHGSEESIMPSAER